MKDSTGVSANATVVVKIGGNTYESSGQLPAVYLSESGELSIPVEVQDGQYSKNDKIEITFSVRSMIFSNPGSESGINFYWGSEEYAAALTMSFPLVTVEIRDASVKGSLVFFPVRLSSGFGIEYGPLHPVVYWFRMLKSQKARLLIPMKTGWMSHLFGILVRATGFG